MQASEKQEDDLVIYNYPVAFTGKVSSHCCWRLHMSTLMARCCCSHASAQHDILHMPCTYAMFDPLQYDESNFEEW